MDVLNKLVLPVITIDEQGVSVFSEQTFELPQRGGMYLSEQQRAINFRLRKSDAGYFADWHVAGDPTLISVSQGTLRISLRNGEYRDFSDGDMFIAKDCLLPGAEFDPKIHGHTAEVISENPLTAIHIKLELT